MEAARTSETSVYFCETTRRHVPEGCRLYTLCREDLSRIMKSQASAMWQRMSPIPNNS
jgi:hypothetical protein